MKKENGIQDNGWEMQYKSKGLFAQRLYPNESLVAFLGGEGLFKLPYEERKQIKILEVGCGSGANLWMMAKEGMDVYGNDISEEALKIAKTHLHDKWGVEAHLTKAAFGCLPYSDSSFDYVVDVVSLQHIDKLSSLTALKEIFRVLKPGGKFFSYRLSDHSCIYLSGGGSFIDAYTKDNVEDTGMPLNNNRTMSFWGVGTVNEMYGASGLAVKSIERHTRTYNNGLISLEYLAIVGVKE